MKNLKNRPRNIRLLRLPEVLEKTSLSRSTIYQLAKEGSFPKPIKLSQRSSAWVESEVEAWAMGRIQLRGGEK